MVNELIELIPYGLAVSRRCTCPTPINICRSVGLRETIIALCGCGLDDYAKHSKIDQDGKDFAATDRFNELLVDRTIASAFLKRIIIVA